MVNRNLIRDFEIEEQDIEQAFSSFGVSAEEALPSIYVDQQQEFDPNKVVVGKVRELHDNDVVVDVGYKSEGIIPLNEWWDEATNKITPPAVGDEVPCSSLKTLMTPTAS